MLTKCVALLPAMFICLFFFSLAVVFDAPPPHQPENLLLSASGTVKLSDFGWSVKAVPPVEHVRSTLCGTPEYVAPEMLVAAPRYTKAVDIWSLGVLAFELLSGEGRTV